MKGAYKEVKGDIFKITLESEKDEYQAFVHGCNCFCNMGAGVALGVKKHFSEAFVADCQTTRGDRKKMGDISHAICNFGECNSIVVVNAYTQYRYGRGGPHLEYGAVRSCIARTCDLFAWGSDGRATMPHLIMPMIGAGYAGGDWKDISGILRECVDYHDINITVVVYDG